MERTTEILVRTFRMGYPDGSNVARMETVEVQIEWPNGKPKDPDPTGYDTAGYWVIAVREAGAE